MKIKMWRTCHLWMLIGLCIFGALCVDAFDFEKLKTRNNLNKPLPIFEKHFSNIISIGDEADGLETVITVSNKHQKKENETVQIIKREKTIGNKIHNKKHLLHASKSDEKSLAKRDNFFFRLFSDNYKPHKQRSSIKKRREIINDTFYPISHPVIPLTHFGRDRKISDDKICKTQIIKFFPKQMRKGYENKNVIGNESHRQLLFNDNNNEWELRQDIFVGEILPFREKAEFGIKDMFHNEEKTLFDDILSIFTMLPFSIFDTIYVKLSTTERPKLAVVGLDSIDHADRSDYDDTTYFIESQRNKRQANSVGLSNHTSIKPITTVAHLNENVVTNDTAKDNKAEVVSTELSNKSVSEYTGKTGTTDVTNDKISGSTNAAESVEPVHKMMLTDYKPVAPFVTNYTNANASEKAKALTDLVKESKPMTVPHTVYELVNATGQTSSTSTVAELSKHKVLNSKEADLLDIKENDSDRFVDNGPLKNVESVEESEQSPGSDKNTFIMILGIIPGLVGLIIAVGVVGIWMIQKNSSWTDRSSQGNEPTTSAQGKPVIPCNI